MELKTKQQIEYNGKTIKMPFEIYPEFLNDQEVEASNHFSGQSTTLPQFAKAVRDAILGAELLGDYPKVRKGLDWFRQHFAKQYMVLLD
jgi:hypothetical protein